MALDFLTQKEATEPTKAKKKIFPEEIVFVVPREEQKKNPGATAPVAKTNKHFWDRFVSRKVLKPQEIIAKQESPKKNFSIAKPSTEAERLIPLSTPLGTVLQQPKSSHSRFRFWKNLFHPRQSAPQDQRVQRVNEFPRDKVARYSAKEKKKQSLSVIPRSAVLWESSALSNKNTNKKNKDSLPKSSFRALPIKGFIFVLGAICLLALLFGLLKLEHGEQTKNILALREILSARKQKEKNFQANMPIFHRMLAMEELLPLQRYWSHALRFILDHTNEGIIYSEWTTVGENGMRLNVVAPDFDVALGQIQRFEGEKNVVENISVIWGNDIDTSLNVQEIKQLPRTSGVVFFRLYVTWKQDFLKNASYSMPKL